MSDYQGDGLGRRFTEAEAARACDVSRSTLHRRRKAGEFPNAERDEQAPGRPWRIPLADLLAAGLNPGRPAPPDEVPADPARGHVHEEPAGTPVVPAPPDAPDDAVARVRAEVAELERQTERARAADAASEELRELRAELEEWRRRAAVAEAVAEERAQALELARRMLPAGPSEDREPVRAGTSWPLVALTVAAVLGLLAVAVAVVLSGA